ncbi:MAG: hypothetical protein IPP45_10100 [Sphingomonadales bacterium]|nr:hypothetical protein [Sphingomonadales bacterium]
MPVRITESSIRTPCHFCGVIDLKATSWRNSHRWSFAPGTAGAATVLSMSGPMARSSADLALALDLTSVPPLPQAACKFQGCAHSIAGRIHWLLSVRRSPRRYVTPRTSQQTKVQSFQ